jgi:hypothetical protein
MKVLLAGVFLSKKAIIRLDVVAQTAACQVI